MMSHKNGWWLVVGCSLMQIIAEQRIENGLLSGLGFAACQSKNPENPQSPELPLYKEILQFLPKLRKKYYLCAKFAEYVKEKHQKTPPCRHSAGM